MAGLMTKIGGSYRALINALRYKRPVTGGIVRPDPSFDFARSAISDNLDFKRLRSLLRSSVDSDVACALQLFEEMKQKDANLRCLSEIRIAALVGLEYQVVSAADVEDMEDRKLADEAADFVREQISKIEGFDESLEHMAVAIDTNLQVVEPVWDYNDIVAMQGVPYWRLKMDLQRPGVVRVETPDNRVGYEAAPPNFIVHSPYDACGYPLTKSRMWSAALVYLIKMLAIADWAVFAEIFGMPVRWAHYPPTASTQERDELLEMMENLGSKAYGIFSQGVTLEMKESSQRGTHPFEALVNWCDRTHAKLWLGGNLTSDTTGGTGTHAAASVQDDVREDLRDDDIKREARTIRSQLIAPMVWYKFKREVPLPFFERVKPEVVDRNQLAQLIATASSLGMGVPRKWAHDELGIPEPQDGDSVLDVPLDGFDAGFAGETDSAA